MEIATASIRGSRESCCRSYKGPLDQQKKDRWARKSGLLDMESGPLDE